MLSSSNPASECTACYHFLAAFASLLHLLLPVSVGVAGVVRVERTRRSLKFFGCLKVTRGGFSLASHNVRRERKGLVTLQVN